MNASLLVSLSLLMPAAAEKPVEYVRDIKPILSRYCFSCHGPKRQRNGLRLDFARAIRKGGNRGPAVVPGKSANSLIIHALTGKGDLSMPPRGPRMKPAQIALVAAWIDAGAIVPADEVALEDTRPGQDHWAFQPLRPGPLPRVRQPEWVRNPIDAFILARLEERGVNPSPEADRITLLRRVYLDLIGLLPTPEEVDAFLADDSADAYEKVVDRLLASPAYGEKWARHWLDRARYADSNGYSIDSPRSIWPYRDWVIGAFNQDLPFDRFTIEQLAGDLLPDAGLAEHVATGFHRNTQINEEGGIDKEQFRVEANINRTNTTGTVFLGLTVGCAQCHDHKFDPFSQREFYQLYAFFNSTEDRKMELAEPEQLAQRTRLRRQIATLEKELKVLDRTTAKQLARWEGGLPPAIKAQLPAEIQHIIAIASNGRTPEQQRDLYTYYRRLDEARHVLGGLGQPTPYLGLAHARGLSRRLFLEEKIVALKKQVPAIPSTLVLQKRAKPRITHIHVGGDFLRKGARVEPGTPGVLPPLAETKGMATRLDLARWLVDGNNPLPPRVTVNRFWQTFFGLGLVETENDFGTQGTRPSHPRLLDWLAQEFIRSGWSGKAMHRLIVTSATYKQASHVRPDLATIDPRNRLLARQNRLRLPAEVVRDVALSASGLLAQKIGGPSVFPPQPSGVYAFTQVPRVWRTSKGLDRYRRGMYTHFWRSAPHPGLVVFDAPNANQACTRRNRSNTPLQALTLLNDEAFFECAQALATRLLEEQGSDEERLRLAFRLSLAREPGEREKVVLGNLLNQQRETFAHELQQARELAPPAFREDRENLTEAASWTVVARVLLNLDEFITRE
jgi:mono/diheme cytochrome c family protein